MTTCRECECRFGEPSRGGLCRECYEKLEMRAMRGPALVSSQSNWENEGLLHGDGVQRLSPSRDRGPYRGRVA